MRTGDPFRKIVEFADATGAPVTYANRAAAEAAGWALTFTAHADGSAVTVAWTLAPIGTTGRHWLVVTVPAVDVVAWWSGVPSGRQAPFIDFIILDPSIYGPDDIMAQMTTTIAVSGGSTVAAMASFAVPHENSLDVTVTVPQEVLTGAGWSSLSGVTLSGAIRRADDNSPTDVPLVALVSGTHLFNPSGRNIRLKWDTMPAALDTAMDAAAIANGRKEFRYTIRGVKDGIIKDLVSGTITVTRSEVRS